MQIKNIILNVLAVCVLKHCDEEHFLTQTTIMSI